MGLAKKKYTKQNLYVLISKDVQDILLCENDKLSNYVYNSVQVGVGVIYLYMNRKLLSVVIFGGGDIWIVENYLSSPFMLFDNFKDMSIQFVMTFKTT